MVYIVLDISDILDLRYRTEYSTNSICNYRGPLPFVEGDVKPYNQWKSSAAFFEEMFVIRLHMLKSPILFLQSPERGGVSSNPASWPAPGALDHGFRIYPRKEIFLQMVESTARGGLVDSKPAFECLFRFPSVFELG